VRELVVRDDRELRRLNQAIAAFEHKPNADRLRMHHLLAALIAARDEIRQAARRPRPPRGPRKRWIDSILTGSET
jgi:hypothetical protein